MEGFRRTNHHEPRPSISEGDFLQMHNGAPIPRWYREPGEETGHKPWQHTPLTPYDPGVINHQNELYNAFFHLAIDPYPSDIDAALKDVVIVEYMASNARRQTQCDANFHHWSENHPNELDRIMQDEKLHWLLEEAKHGYGNPASLLQLLQAAPSLKSLDLQVITTPYGYRRHHLPEMQQELKLAIEAVDGHYFDVPFDLPGQPFVALHNSNPDDVDAPTKYALVVINKKLVATCDAPNIDPALTDEIKVVQRDAFVIDINDERFQPIIKKITDDSEFTKQDAFRDQARAMIDAKDGVIPTSTMVYAYRVAAATN